MLHGKEEQKDGAGATAKAEEAKPKEDNFEFKYNLQLPLWLISNQISLGFTTYQIGKVFLIGRHPNKGPGLWFFERTFEQPMGLASSADGQQLAMGALFEIVRFSHLGVETSYKDINYDKNYVPQVRYITAKCDAHDLGFDQNGKIIFVNTMLSCVATVSETHSCAPIWWPSFISKLVDEDRCHLNGLGWRDGEPRYVTACSRTDTKAGWRNYREKGGVVIDIKTNEVLCEGLSMPHSPRWHAGKLWVLNSGEGDFGYVDMKTKQFKPIAFCEGFARGLSFHNNVAVIGLSKPRDGEIFKGLGLQRKLQAKRKVAAAGLQLVDINTEVSLLALAMPEDIKEIYDVTILPNTRRPMMEGFRDGRIKYIITLDRAPLNQPVAKKKEEEEKSVDISSEVSPSLFAPVKEEKSKKTVKAQFIPAPTPPLQPNVLSETVSASDQLAEKRENEKSSVLSTSTVQRLRALALFGVFASAAVATVWLMSESPEETECLHEGIDADTQVGCRIM